MLECMEILSIASQKRVNLYAVKGKWQLDGTLQSKIMAMAFTMAAEIERDLISQRTKEALAARCGRSERGDGLASSCCLEGSGKISGLIEKLGYNP